MNEKDFPILKQKVHGKRLVYLDNAATSQKPKQVINAISTYYNTINANTHRGIHTLATKATDAFEQTREKIAQFINAQTEEIVFTRGTTESINLVANGLKHLLRKGDEIVLSEMEHHSNLVPWQMVARETGAVLKFIPITSEYYLDMNQAKKIITAKTKIVSITHCSNVLGTINDVKAIAELAHEHDAIMIVDAAQLVPHVQINVRKIDCDFLAFSAHKMCGPTGVGVLYGKKELLALLEPLQYGGHMIREVTFTTASWNDVPWKYEAGTANIADIVAFGTTIDYLNGIGMKRIGKENDILIAYALQQIKKIPQVKIIGPQTMKNRGAVLSFHIEGMHPHDVSELLDREGVAIRGGHHCAMPLMKKIGLPGTSRASFYFYNTKKDVDALIAALKKAIKVFQL